MEASDLLGLGAGGSGARGLGGRIGPPRAPRPRAPPRPAALGDEEGGLGGAPGPRGPVDAAAATVGPGPPGAASPPVSTRRAGPPAGRTGRWAGRGRAAATLNQLVQRGARGGVAGRGAQGRSGTQGCPRAAGGAGYASGVRPGSPRPREEPSPWGSDRSRAGGKGPRSGMERGRGVGGPGACRGGRGGRVTKGRGLARTSRVLPPQS